ncbi:long-chain-fatty-acid--CoA ligase [compost metagenome]
MKASQGVEPADSIAWCRDRLSLYKYPRRLAILEAMPLSPTGKVLKRELPLEILG